MLFGKVQRIAKSDLFSLKCLYKYIHPRTYTCTTYLLIPVTLHDFLMIYAAIKVAQHTGSLNLLTSSVD